MSYYLTGLYLIESVEFHGLMMVLMFHDNTNHYLNKLIKKILIFSKSFNLFTVI